MRALPVRQQYASSSTLATSCPSTACRNLGITDCNLKDGGGLLQGRPLTGQLLADLGKPGLEPHSGMLSQAPRGGRLSSTSSTTQVRSSERPRASVLIKEPKRHSLGGQKLPKPEAPGPSVKGLCARCLNHNLDWTQCWHQFRDLQPWQSTSTKPSDASSIRA